MNGPTWIVFEGIDGSGKTTQAKLLNDYLNRHGVRSRYKHVFDTRAGKLLRDLFLNNAFSNTVEILILCATRQAFLDEILAETVDEQELDVLIIDRFFLSILAMQGKVESDRQLINDIKRTIDIDGHDSFVFYLDTAPEECKKRLRKRHIRDRIEAKSIGFHRTVSERYLTLLRTEENVYQFRGDVGVEKLHRAIVDTAVGVLGLTEIDDIAARGEGRAHGSRSR